MRNELSGSCSGSAIGFQSAIKQKPNVNDSMDSAEKSLESLYQSVEILRNRLEIVLSPSEPKEDCSKECDPETCPLVSRLNGHRRKIHSLESVINDTLDRLEL